MMWIFGIVLISGMKALLCKGFSLGGFLLLFWIKGRQLRFNSDEWDSFFISLPERKLQKYVICIYLVAAMFSSFISYFILELAGYRNSIGIAILIFAVGVTDQSLQMAYKIKGLTDQTVTRNTRHDP